MTVDDGPRVRAEQRLAILARQLERVGLDGGVITDADPPGRDLLRRQTEDAIEAAGLAELLADGRARFRDWVQGAYNRMRSDLKVFQYAWGTTMGPVEDRVNVFLAVDDAVLATVAHELIREDDRAALLEPYDRLIGS
ncbi:MAG: hypothetical protein QOF11_770 [Chloroflexota bacterium]|nr:hypothetical protein [Chloroflexota bacterium]